MKLLILFISALSLFATEPNFGKYDGTGIVIDLNSSKRVVFGTRAHERLSPCSTFKIPHSMIALDSGAIKDENVSILWDGVVREYPAWNRNHSMRSAIGVSTVWFYQETARRIGETRMHEMVSRIGYGNMNTSRTLTDFWLGNGSLKISANEQADFLSKLVRNQLPFTERAQLLTKDIMTLEKKEGYTLAGKTGSCDGAGWFVGFVIDHNTTRVFAFNIRGIGANGAEAKKMVMEYLKGSENK